MKFMKYSIKYWAAACLFGMGLSACNDFEDVNTDQNAAREEMVSVQGLFNSSVADAQLTYWERDILFIRTWAWGARYIFRPIHGPQVLQDYNDYMTDYWTALASWIFKASEAIRIGEERIAAGTADATTNNYVQMARIWRAHLLSEAADAFGPYPAKEGFKGIVAHYNSVDEVYAYADEELAKGIAALDESKQVAGDSYDAFYSGDIKKWKKYGNSIRLRLAMRFSNVGTTGKERFEQTLREAGGINGLISTTADIASVAQADISTEDDAGSVFDCDYIGMQPTQTVTNIGFGIGGVKLEDLSRVAGTSAYGLPAEALAATADPNQYLGLYIPDELPTKTNVETAGYLFDKLPAVIDPRVLAVYSIPGHTERNFYSEDTYSTKFEFNSSKEANKKYEIEGRYTFSSFTCGDYTGRNSLIATMRSNYGALPAIASTFRRGAYRRVFFGDWETYFLLAEAAVYGWETGGTAEDWYEKGVEASFAYHNLPQFAQTYLQSESYNRIGTSAKFSHTTEPQDAAMSRTVFGTGATEAVTYHYPTTVTGKHNDALMKIMTQKYIAQMPWLPQEVTNDYRRTGCPFFENPMLEGLLPYMPFYTDASKTDIRNVYRRVRYPFSLAAKDPEGYQEALKLLGGEDKPQTPLVWHLQ